MKFYFTKAKEWYLGQEWRKRIILAAVAACALGMLTSAIWSLF